MYKSFHNKYNKHYQSVAMLGFVLCILLSCSCQNPLASQQQLELVWSRSLSTGELIDGRFPNYIYGDGVLTLGSRNKKPVLYMVRRGNGDIVWEWQDFFADDQSVFVNYLHLYQTTLVIQNGRYRYGIDILTGKTLWKTSGLSGRSLLTGIGKQYFFSANEQGIVMGDVQSGKENILLSFQDTIYRYNRGGMDPVPFIGKSGDTLLTITMTAAQQLPSTSYTSLMLYNFSTRRVEYNRFQIGGSGLGPLGAFVPYGLHVVWKDRVFICIGRTVQCNDIYSGNLLWRDSTNISEAFGFSPLQIINDKLIGNSDDGFLYCFNPNNGSIEWKTQTSATPKGVLHQNNIIYIVGGGDGLLHAVNTDGKYLFNLQSPDDKPSNGRSFFTDKITGDGQYIYVRTFLNLYCYKAAR